MADWYVDKTNGDDLNAGTSVAPFENIQAGFDVATTGDTIYVANTSAQTGTFNLPAAVGNTSVLLIKAWDNGGAITLTLPNGNTRVAWEYDGQSTATELAVDTGNVAIEGLKLHSINDMYSLSLNGIYSALYQCELYGSGTAAVLECVRGIVDDCYIHDVIDGAAGMRVDLTSTIVNCKVDGDGGTGIGINVSTSNTNTQVSHCVVTGFGRGVEIVDPSCSLTHSTIDSCTTGVSITGNCRGDLVSHNLITNCTTAISGTNANVFYVAKNAVWNNTTDLDLNAVVRNFGNNIVETSNPYVNSAAGDFRIASTAAIASESDCYGALPVVSSGGGGNAMAAFRNGLAIGRRS